jgi:plastocyanin
VKRSAVLLVVLALAACGGNGDEDAEESTTTAPVATGATQTVSLVDYALEPKTIRIDKPGTYTFEATNNGQTEHALEIEGGGVEDETETLAPGEKGTITVELNMGEYEMYCPVDSHRDRGMDGSIDVAG